jgi:hypothetical protein
MAHGIDEKTTPVMEDSTVVSNGSREPSDIEKAEVDLKEEIDKGAVPEGARMHYTKEEEAAVIRKLDWHLMPLIFVLYSLSVLDRSNLGNARIAGLTKDIDLEGRRYDWLGTVFYISCTFPRISSTQRFIRYLTFARRYLVSVDANWLESIPTSPLGSSRRFRLGSCLHHASNYYQLGWTHGMPCTACHT